MLPESQILASYDLLNAQIDAQAKEEQRKKGIRYLIYAGASLVLFAIVMFSIKKLKK